MIRTLLNRLLCRADANATRVVVLGNQKSGTSAIAHLLADHAGLTKTIDIPETWGTNLKKLLTGEVTLKELSHTYPERFFRQVVKEPNLTFFCSQVKEIYNQSRFVFVLRDPRDNIRSILNFIHVPGNRAHLKDDLPAMDPLWRPIFDPLPFNLGPMTHPMDILAARWNHVADVYLKNKETFHPIRYETFCANKTRAIDTLAADLGLPKVNDISARVDIPYQPGGDRDISWIDFFGEENLHRIEKRCKGSMERLGYPCSIG